MMLTDQTVLLREICNGMMFVSSIILIGVFVHYMIVRCGELRHCYKDMAVQAAGAIIVLMVGHAIRAGSSWLEFLWLRLGWEASAWWANTLQIFIVATALTIIGKMLVTWAFAPHRWRWHLALFIGVAAVVAPLIVALLTGGHS